MADRSSFDLRATWDGTSLAQRQTSPKLPDSPRLPDIYYIIPDGYPSDIFLQEAMNHDNSAFTEALEARGFTVAEHARSNYAGTLLSLPSILNMRYFHSNDSELGDLDYLRLAIADSLVARKLLQRGYTFVSLLSGYGIPSPIADINRDFKADGPVDIHFQHPNFTATIADDGEGDGARALELAYFYQQSFLPLYLDTTLLRIAAEELRRLTSRQDYLRLYDLFEPRRFLDTAAEAQRIAQMPEATFAIIHLMKPHGPVTFDASGNFIKPVKRPSRDVFFAEFEFVNATLLGMIDGILDASAHPPVIIFQADHGTLYGRVIDAEGVASYFDVYAAYHMPAGASLSIPESFTLINSFPLVFNDLFGTDYPLLEDRLLLAPRGYDAPFDQLDVTAEVARR